MSSLSANIRLLQDDLLARPMRISAYHDLPFAILRYDAAEEWKLRREVMQLARRLDIAGKRVQIISLAELLWEVVEEAEGIETVAQLERLRGFEVTQQQVTTYLVDPEWSPLPLVLKDRLDPLDPEQNVVFLTRAAAMAPSVYHMSRLLDEMQGKTRVPTVLFYPGELEGATGLRFMGLRDRESTGNYRVKVYG